jgi:catechol 2,3-dioxygenase-like lactoylglutathione lyase family enzyme
MDQQINAVTIAVNDIKLMRKFYHDNLGWQYLQKIPVW